MSPEQQTVINPVSKTRWVGILISIVYGILSIAFFSQVVYVFGLLAIMGDGPTLLQQANSAGVITRNTYIILTSVAIIMLITIVGGIICSTGTDTHRKRLWGRIFLWLPIALPVVVVLLMGLVERFLGR